jgi:hypothetical protein
MRLLRQMMLYRPSGPQWVADLGWAYMLPAALLVVAQTEDWLAPDSMRQYLTLWAAIGVTVAAMPLMRASRSRWSWPNPGGWLVAFGYLFLAWVAFFAAWAVVRAVAWLA